MSEPDRCPDCGFERPSGGICPRCLIRLGFVGPALSLSHPGDLGATMPLSRDLDGTAVLASIAAKIGPVPRVLLRDTEVGEASSPPVRPSSASMPSAGERPGDLQIFGEIGRGGMGAVLKGRDPDLGRELAVKVLLETHRDDPALIRRFVEEAQIAGQLQHPGIVPVYQLGTFADHRPYFSMKLIKGRTLAEMLAGRTPVDGEIARFLAIFEHVCQTMAYAHSRGVIHRDLKPSNIMVGSFGEVQVMDWGLAKILARGGVVDDAQAGHTGTSARETVIATVRVATEDNASLAGSVLGTPSYMAPEQARGEGDRLDERADVFALGSILCEIVTGQPAFVGRTSGEIQRKAAAGDLTDASARLTGSGADAEVVSLALACLAREPEDRLRHAGAVNDRVAAHLAGVQKRLRDSEIDRAAAAARATQAVLTAQAAEARVVAERRARRLTVALAASLIGLVALGGGGFAWSERQRTARVARASAGAVETLEEASRIAATARSEPRNPARWAEAEAAVRRADEVAQRSEADATTRRRAAQALAEVGRERAKADEQLKAEQADRHLVERLAEIRARYVDEGLGISADSAYADAFREAGLDPEFRPNEAGRAIASRPRAIAEAIAAGLDDWASLRRKPGPGVLRPATPLAQAARIADPEPWRVALRSALERPGRMEIRAELLRLKDTAQLDTLSPVSADLLARALSDNAEHRAAVATLREAQRWNPGDLWINYDLGRSLTITGKGREAVRYLAAAQAIRPATGFYLARALHTAGELDEAIAVLRELVRSQPKGGIHAQYLAGLLTEQGRWAEGDQALDAAIAAFREATRLHPDDANAWLRLGMCLDRRGKPGETEAALREAIRARPDIGGPYGVLARHLTTRPGRLAEAETALRESIRLIPIPGLTRQQLDLAAILTGRRKSAEAEAAYRKAIEYQSNAARAHFGLAEFLESEARPEEALASYRRAARETDPYRTDKVRIAESIRRVERQITLSPRLAAILDGEDQAVDAAGALDRAELCRNRHRPAAAVRFFDQAMSLDPKIIDDVVARPRYEAARVAATAGIGEGEDDPRPDEAARAGLRARALGWLRDELTVWAGLAPSPDPKARARAHDALARWIIDPDLAGVRDPAAIESLPEGERPSWRSLWVEVEALFLQTAAAAS